jgi:hypothetical protein
MTEIQNPKQKNNRLVLGIWNFRNKTPRQSHLSLTWPKGPGFSGQSKRLQVSILYKSSRKQYVVGRILYGRLFRYCMV